MTATPPLRLRLVSWWWDYLLIVAWLTVVFVLIGIPQLIGWWDLSDIWGNQLSTDVAITILTVVPYFLYLVVCEGRDPHATWGKGRAGLEVIGRYGGLPGLGRIVIRNLVKVLPWQMAHMGTARLAATTEPTAVGIWLQVVSIVLLVLIVGPILFRRPGLHDLLAGTRVASVTQNRRG